MVDNFCESALQSGDDSELRAPGVMAAKLRWLTRIRIVKWFLE
jgi:hypothetical protein